MFSKYMHRLGCVIMRGSIGLMLDAAAHVYCVDERCVVCARCFGCSAESVRCVRARCNSCSAAQMQPLLCQRGCLRNKPPVLSDVAYTPRIGVL